MRELKREQQKIKRFESEENAKNLTIGKDLSKREEKPEEKKYKSFLANGFLFQR